MSVFKDKISITILIVGFVLMTGLGILIGAIGINTDTTTETRIYNTITETVYQEVEVEIIKIVENTVYITEYVEVEIETIKIVERIVRIYTERVITETEIIYRDREVIIYREQLIAAFNGGTLWNPLTNEFQTFPTGQWRPIPQDFIHIPPHLTTVFITLIETPRTEYIHVYIDREVFIHIQSPIPHFQILRRTGHILPTGQHVHNRMIVSANDLLANDIIERRI